MPANPTLDRLMALLCLPLPRPIRADYERDWLAVCETQPHPLLSALSHLPEVIGLCASYEAPDTQRGTVKRADRLMLLASRSLVVLSGALFSLYLVLYTLADAWTPSMQTWMLTRLIGWVVAAWVAWRGLGRDVHWLRSTRGGSAVLLLGLLAPFLIGWFVPSTGDVMGVVWLCALIIIPTWDAYWGVQHPLKSPGVFGRHR
ncbi:hypothetical protein K7W42_18380 [Deinococcus sp. HMF7604]|uniref:hypothetical protein n=1 Tax=Deinococcus betulae TaxID=2873312 RepID=UPI001CCAE274|nr:hypothetical protein [Deinococcus betulae]MBZ9752811.1 hypothetical protein [Deinococcus betulae]